MVTPNETHTGKLVNLAEAICASLLIGFKRLWGALEKGKVAMWHTFLEGGEQSEELELKEFNFGV